MKRSFIILVGFAMVPLVLLTSQAVAQQPSPLHILVHMKTSLAEDDAQICAVPNVAWASVNAGHQVSALYEIVLHPGAGSATPLAKLNVRYKLPFAVDTGDTSERGAAQAEIAIEINASFVMRDAATGFQVASPGYRRSVVVAQFAEFLRGSVHARDDSIQDLMVEAVSLQPILADPDFDEFVQLLKLATSTMIEKQTRQTTELARTLRELCDAHYEHGRREVAQGAGQPDARRNTVDIA